MKVELARKAQEQACAEGRHRKADQDARTSRGSADAFSKAGEFKLQLAVANGRLGATLECLALDQTRIGELAAQLAAAQEGALSQAADRRTKRIPKP